MDEFAEVTGVSGTTQPRRYLWTDAFAVCNFLGLYRHTGDERYLVLARTLVEQVHFTLGHHRNDDSRQGWISGLSEEEGAKHPTRGGLRIGKPMNERKPHEPPNSELEWEQDGQYFHYLTKWMHALNRMSRETEEERYHRWAVELGVTAHEAFTRELSPGRPKQLAWKMSIDLSRPLVPSTGQHDPLDGLVSLLELQATGEVNAQSRPRLEAAIATMTEMCTPRHWPTADALGIGGLLDDATRLAQLIFDYQMPRRELLSHLLAATQVSFQALGRSSALRRTAEERLPFRELGLSIGIQGLQEISPRVALDRELNESCNALMSYQPLAQQIETFWSDSSNRLSSTWSDHRDINTVMLAASLAPQGYLQL
jgi:hypothetical protein